MTRGNILVLLAAVATASMASAADSALKVDAVFADHMVIQQGKAIPVHGSATPGETVSVAFNDAWASGRADANGRWTVQLPAQSGGLIGTLRVSSEGGERVSFADVAVGQVWLCSGQSNMDLTVANAANPERTAREAVGLPIRLLKIRRTATAAPAATFAAEIPWSAASETSVPEFSAACWHMARTLRANGIDVPIGLIHAAWGGSTIEDWMSPEALRIGGVPEENLSLLTDYAADPVATTAKAIDRTDQWAFANDPGSAPDGGWFADRFDDSGWAAIDVPGLWERSGIKVLTSYDGVLWFRRTFDLSPEQAAASANLNLGRIDERDRVWVNGRPVGATLAGDVSRSYSLPAGTLRAGTNTIAVRVIDEMGSGGFGGPPRALTLESASGGSVSLAGPWRYRAGSSDEQWTVPPPFLSWAAPRGLAMAWGGMIAPLHDFPLAGIAWYQGESNTARAASYAKLLDSWRADWRRQFRDPELPVVIVQLPGYGGRAARPSDGGWPQLREAQRLTARADPKTGLAVTIDIGMSTDIHPAHKDVVGQRIGLEAMRVAYGASKPVAPSPVSARRARNGVVVEFAGAPEGLIVYGSASPTAFEWCDAAKACRFADGVVDGASVVVAAPAQAAFIRYAWQGFPPINLYGSAGLPVVPFEVPVL